MLKPNAQKILVIKFRHIGDVLLISPLISTLKHARPGNQVSAAVKPGTEEMLEGHPDINGLYILPVRGAAESKIFFFGRYLQWIWQLRREKFDITINTTEGDRGIVLSYLVNAGVRIGLLKEEGEQLWRTRMISHPVLPIHSRTHTVISNLFMSTPLTKDYMYEVTLNYSKDDLYSVHSLLQAEGWCGGKPLIHIHPTSRWLFKCWKDRYMAEIIDWLETTGYCVVLTAAPINAELQRIGSILQYCTHSPIQLAGKLTLKQLAALSSLSQHFFGVDSAPMHIAASQGTPVIALFGPSGGFNWGPWPNKWDSLQNPYPEKNGIQYAGNNLVIQQSWDCVPCGQDGCDGSKKSRCLDELTPETVIPLIQQQIGDIS